MNDKGGGRVGDVVSLIPTVKTDGVYVMMTVVPMMVILVAVIAIVVVPVIVVVDVIAVVIALMRVTATLLR